MISVTSCNNPVHDDIDDSLRSLLQISTGQATSIRGSAKRTQGCSPLRRHKAALPRGGSLHLRGDRYHVCCSSPTTHRPRPILSMLRIEVYWILQWGNEYVLKNATRREQFLILSLFPPRGLCYLWCNKSKYSIYVMAWTNTCHKNLYVENYWLLTDYLICFSLVVINTKISLSMSTDLEQ